MALEEKMNPLEEVINELTIEFPKKISFSKTTELMEYIAKNLPAEISSNLSYNNQVLYDAENKKMSRYYEQGIKITGNITNYNKTSRFIHDTFEIMNEGRVNKFKGIQFQITPGWDLNQYRPEIRTLWKDVRKVVENYFEEN